MSFVRYHFHRTAKPYIASDFVDPICLGGQMLPAIAQLLPEVPIVSSYHTNLATYATLFGFSWLSAIMWRLMRFLHGRYELASLRSVPRLTQRAAAP
jgi:hypothetical protein